MMPVSSSLARAVLALAAGALAGAAVAAPPPNAFDMRLRSLSPLYQHSVLRRAILDNAYACGRVTRVLARGPYGNLRMWEAACDRGGSYAAFIGPDGTVQVRDCGNLAELKLPRCVLPPEPPPVPPRRH